MLDKMQLKIFIIIIIIIDLISDGCTLHHLLFPYIRFLFPPLHGNQIAWRGGGVMPHLRI